MDKGARYRWVYGLWTKNETFNTIALREIIWMRTRPTCVSSVRNAAKLSDTPHHMSRGRTEQVAIRILGRLTRSILAGTGLQVDSWFSGLVTAISRNGYRSEYHWAEVLGSQGDEDLHHEQLNEGRLPLKPAIEQPLAVGPEVPNLFELPPEPGKGAEILARRLYRNLPYHCSRGSGSTRWLGNLPRTSGMQYH